MEPMTESPQSKAVTPSPSQYDFYGLSHAGRVRRENQDHFLIASLHKTMQVYQTSLDGEELGTLTSPPRGLVFLVADGVGGVPGGKRASGTALRAIADFVTTSMDLFYTHHPHGPEAEPGYLEELKRSVERSHEVVSREGERLSGGHGRAGMATTLTMVTVRWPKAYLVHVGDSRCYRLRDGGLERMTRDQTMAQALADAGVISADQVEKSGLRHVLWSAVGGTQATPEVMTSEVRWDDIMLLCTDGLTKHVSDDEIRQQLLEVPSAAEVCQNLVTLALDRGGTDNVTVVVARLRRQ